MVVRIGRPGGVEKLEEIPGGLDAGTRLGEVHGAIEHHFAVGEEGVPAGEGVVTDVGDAVGRKAVAANAHQAVARFGWNPRVEAVGDDVVECAETLVNCGQVDGVEGHIEQARICGHFAPIGDLHLGEVDAHIFAVWVEGSHGHDI